MIDGGLAVDTLFLDRYRVVRRIAAGGMGAVYEVRDQKTDKRRALKVMLPAALEDPDFRARFEREARITGGIESDHVVHVSDAGIDEATQTPFLVMELLTGEELSRIVKRKGALPPSEALIYLLQAARGLEKTHAAGIVHRDLKPDNLFVTSADDGSPRLKILDFGIAKVVAPGSDKTTRALGTPKYMAPEQMKGDPLGPFTDIYALGHIAYTLLAGEAYWTEEEKDSREALFAFLAKVIAGPSESASARALRRTNVTLPAAFDEWFLRMTSPRREERFPSAVIGITALADIFGIETQGGIGRLSISGVSGEVVSRPAPVTEMAGRTPAEEPTRVEPATTGRNWGSTLAEPKGRLSWKVGVAIALGGAVLAAALYVFRPAAQGPATPTMASPDSAPSLSSTQVIITPTSSPSTGPTPAVSSAATSSATAKSGQSAPKSTGTGAKPVTSASSGASPSASAPLVIDPWAAPGRSVKPAQAPAPTSKPGMF